MNVIVLTSGAHARGLRQTLSHLAATQGDAYVLGEQLGRLQVAYELPLRSEVTHVL